MLWLVLLLAAPICPSDTAERESLATVTLEESWSRFRIGQYNEHDMIRITWNGDFASWPGTGSEQDPYVIEGLNITGPHDSVRVSDTTAHFVIQSCMLRCTAQGYTPLILNNVSNGLVRSCVFLYGNEGGMILSSVNCTVKDCVIRNNGYGIWMSGADNCTLSGNVAYLNTEGFDLVNTTRALIINNTCFRNSVAGIRVTSDSRQNTLFLNSLGWNPREGQPFVNAIDDGQLSLWDDNVSKGNYWNDYTGAGSHLIRGAAVSQDRYPSKLLDVVAPEVDHPSDVWFELNGTMPSITWHARDRFPDRYVLFWDGISMPSEVWNGEDIQTLVPVLPIGTHNCTLLVYDIAGNTAADTVEVAMGFSMLGGLDTDLIAVASAVSVVLVIASILVVKAMR